MVLKKLLGLLTLPCTLSIQLLKRTICFQFWILQREHFGLLTCLACLKTHFHNTLATSQMICENISIGGTSFMDPLVFIKNAVVMAFLVPILAAVKGIIYWRKCNYRFFFNVYRFLGFRDPVRQLPEEVDENLPHLCYL